MNFARFIPASQIYMTQDLSAADHPGGRKIIAIWCRAAMASDCRGAALD
jgi:hypothetical protein